MKTPNTKKYLKTLLKIAEAKESILYLRFKWNMNIQQSLDSLIETERDIANVDLTTGRDFNQVEGRYEDAN